MGEFYINPISGGVIAAGRHAGKSGRMVVAGDSLTDWAPAFPWGLGLMGATCPVVYNAGVASNTLDDLWARWDADVLAKNPDIVGLRIGTNSLSLDDATFRSKYQRFLDSLVATGIYGLIHAIPPRFDDSTHRAVAHNAWLLSQCLADPTSFGFVDDSIDLGDANYDVIPEFFLEGSLGIHMNGKGRYRQGKRQAIVYRDKLTRLSPLILDSADTYAVNSLSNQWVNNPLMAGGGTPTNWALSNSGGGTSSSDNIIAADVGDANQAPWYRATLNAFGAAEHSATFSHYLRHPVIAADLNTVKRVDIVFECRFNAINGAFVKSLNVDCRAGSSRISPLFSLPMPEDEVITETIVVRSSLGRGEEGTTVDAYTANSLVLEIQLVARTACGPAGSIDIRCASVRGLGE